MSRYSMEIKALLEKKRLNKSRFNPEASFNVIAQSPQNKTMKRCESASSLRRKQPSDISSLESKYRSLEQNYQRLLDSTKQRNRFEEQSKRQIEKLNNQHEKDTKEVDRLRSMLGFMPKRNQGVQTMTPTADMETSGFSGMSSVWNNKIERETASGEISDHAPKPKLLKKSYMGSLIRRQFLGKDIDIARSPHKSRSPTNRYRFIPSIPLR